MKQQSQPSDLATKQDIIDLENRFDDKLDKKFKLYNDEIMNKLDQVMGELQTLRDENTIGAYQTRELREVTDDHEKRITKLEKNIHN